MFEIKMKARYVLHKRRLFMCARLFSVYVSALCSIICLLGGAAFLSGAAVLPYVGKALSVVAGVSGISAAFAFLAISASA